MRSLIGGWLAGALWSVAAAIKNAIVSDQPRYLKVRRGPARGAILRTTYRWGSRTIFGLYESEITRYLRRYVNSGDVCYDIGAAGGYYAFAFARLAAPGRVYSFEMDEECAMQLEALTARNEHLGSVVSVHQTRVGDADLDESRTSLDAIVYKHGWQKPDVVKIDAEGSELDILRGAERLLRDHHPRLIIEVHSMHLEKACQRLLENASYKPIVVSNRLVMAENAFRGVGHNRWLCAE